MEIDIRLAHEYSRHTPWTGQLCAINFLWQRGGRFLITLRLRH
jgi:hypothetical protein